MTAISKHIVFNIIIIEENKSDHTFLRKVIHSIVPQAIVESVYTGDEAIRYFNNCSSIPHLIFLDQDMVKVSGRNTLELIKRVDGLDKVPVIFLTSPNANSQPTDLIKQNTDLFYSKPYAAQDLLNIVSSVNNKWLA